MRTCFEFALQQNVSTPIIQHSINETATVTNGETGMTTNQPTADLISNGEYISGNDSMEHPTLLLRNVSMPAFWTGKNPLTDLYESNKSKNFNASSLTQKEDVTMPVNTDELANEIAQSCSTTDRIASVSIQPANSTAICPQGLPTLTSLHDMVHEHEKNAPLHPIFQATESFIDNGQTNGVNNGHNCNPKTKSTTPSDATVPEFSDFDDNFMIETDLTNDTSFGGIDEVIPDIEQASGSRINESTNQVTEVDLTCEDDQLSPDDTGNHMHRNTVHREETERRNRKISDVLISDGNLKKSQKTGLRSTLLTIPESPSSGKISEQTHSASGRVVQRNDAGPSDAGKQTISTSDEKHVAQKKCHVKGSTGVGGQKVHKCESCPYTAKYKSYVEIHARIHTNEKPFKCKFCPKSFLRSPDLKVHMRTHVNEFRLHCSNCLQGFDVEKEMEEHESGCKKRRYKCSDCKYSTFKNTDLIRHMYQHTDEKPFKCKLCPKSFTRSDYLKDHTKTHANGFQFHCSNCLQGFDVKKDKEAHENSCKILRYECYVCKYSTLRRSDLVKHMTNRHESFQCKVCMKGFIKAVHFKNHMKVHANDSSFQCRICLQGFDVKTEKEAHESSCNQCRYECFTCKYSTFSKSDLDRHMRKHSDEKPFKCKFCSKSFNQREYLRRHMKTNVHQFLFHCSNCLHGFDVKKEKEVHEISCVRQCYLRNDFTLKKSNFQSSKKPFRCSDCSNRFTRKNNLIYHLKHNCKFRKINRVVQT